MIVTLLAGCEKDLVVTPDAAVDGPVEPAGNFACVGQPLITTAPDPIRFVGTVSDDDGLLIDGATIEIHSLEDDSLLGQAATGAAGTSGAYEVAVATSGVAPTTYRKATKIGFEDSYLIDAFPVWFSPAGIPQPILTADQQARYYQAAGVTQDPSKGTVAIVVNDCPDAQGATRAVAGATVSIAGADVIYLDSSGDVDLEATATTPRGGAVAFNAAPGPLEVTVTAGPHTYRAWPMIGRQGALVIGPVTP